MKKWIRKLSPSVLVIVLFGFISMISGFLSDKSGRPWLFVFLGYGSVRNR